MSLYLGPFSFFALFVFVRVLVSCYMYCVCVLISVFFLPYNFSWCRLFIVFVCVWTYISHTHTQKSSPFLHITFYFSYCQLLCLLCVCVHTFCSFFSCLLLLLFCCFLFYFCCQLLYLLCVSMFELAPWPKAPPRRWQSQRVTCCGLVPLAAHSQWLQTTKRLSIWALLSTGV